MFKYQHFEELFDLPPLGNEKPSILMAKILALVSKGDTVGICFLGVLFLLRLPEWVATMNHHGGSSR